LQGYKHPYTFFDCLSMMCNRMATQTPFVPGDQDPNMPLTKEDKPSCIDSLCSTSQTLLAAPSFLIPKRMVKDFALHIIQSIEQQMPNSMVMLYSSSSAAPSMMTNTKNVSLKVRSSITLSSKMMIEPNCGH